MVYILDDIALMEIGILHLLAIDAVDLIQIGTDGTDGMLGMVDGLISIGGWGQFHYSCQDTHGIACGLCH